MFKCTLQEMFYEVVQNNQSPKLKFYEGLHPCASAVTLNPATQLMTTHLASIHRTLATPGMAEQSIPSALWPGRMGNTHPPQESSVVLVLMHS